MKGFLLFSDWHSAGIQALSSHGWLTVYSKHRSSNEVNDVWPAIIPLSQTEKVMQTDDLDFNIGVDIRPTAEVRRDDTSGEEVVVYDHYSRLEAIRPLVLVRNFHGIRPDELEILEEFRLFHNLYADKKRSVYIRIKDNGDEQEVVRVSADRIEVRLKELKQYLGFSNSALVIQFWLRRFASIDFKEFEENERRKSYFGEGTRYTVIVGQAGSGKTLSVLNGKHLILGQTPSTGDIWPSSDEEYNYESFIVGVDDNGDELVVSSDPSSFEGHQAAYLTQVFFTRDVLDRYLRDSSKYKVDDGVLFCGGLWMMEFDNNHEEYVIAFLGDLGSKLPYSEQRLWRRFNVVPDGQMSEVHLKRSLMAEFADPSEPVLRFKEAYERFQKSWRRKHDWDLFKPLGEGDQHHFARLQVPSNGNQGQFDEQIVSLSKCLIESLNEKALESALSSKLEEGAKGIKKLTVFLEDNDVPERESISKFFVRLQAIRSKSAAHRKGSSFEKEMANLGVDTSDLRNELREMFERACACLSILTSYAEGGD